MHQKVNVLIFLNICPKKVVLKKMKFDHFLSSILFIFSSQKNPLKCYYNNVSMPWAPCFFPTRASLLPLPSQNPLDHVNSNVGLQICRLENSNSMVTLTCFSLGVNQSGPGTSSTANHRFYKALGRLHDPWCKQPLNTLPQKCMVF